MQSDDWCTSPRNSTQQTEPAISTSSPQGYSNYLQNCRNISARLSVPSLISPMIDILNRLKSLPSEIVLTIFSHLPDAYLRVFLTSSSMRDVAAHCLYKEIYAISENQSPNRMFTSIPHDKTVYMFFEVMKLLKENPDIEPNSLWLDSYASFDGIGVLLSQVGSQIRRIPNLNIDLSHAELYQTDADDLASLDNLRFLKLVHIDTEKCANFRLPSGLKKLSLRSEIGNMALPANLEELELYSESQVGDSDHFNRLLSGIDLKSLIMHDTEQIRFTTLPDSLEKLEIWKNGLTKVPYLSPNLKYADLQLNRITEISSAQWPSSLTTLDLSANDIESLDSVKFPPRLRSLDLRANKIRVITDVNWPDSLLTLEISENPISVVRGPLPRSLQKLNFTYTTLRDITQLEFPESLRNLDLSNNRFSNLAEANLPASLEALQLSDCNLKEHMGISIPENVLELELVANQGLCLSQIKLPQKLNHLRASQCGIRTLKNSNLPESLRVLDLSQNSIRHLRPSDIPGNLQKLDLSYNYIGTIDIVSTPPSLIELSLQRNRISGVGNLCLNDMLETLNLDDNPISKFESKLPRSLKDISINGTSLDVYNGGKGISQTGSQKGKIRQVRVNEQQIIYDEAKRLKVNGYDEDEEDEDYLSSESDPEYSDKEVNSFGDSMDFPYTEAARQLDLIRNPDDHPSEDEDDDGFYPDEFGDFLPAHIGAFHDVMAQHYFNQYGDSDDDPW